jgi:hypothetical protein
VRYYVGMETRNIGNILKMEELLACWCANVNLDLAITFNVGIVIAGKNGINPVVLLKNKGVKSI